MDKSIARAGLPLIVFWIAFTLIAAAGCSDGDGSSDGEDDATAGTSPGDPAVIEIGEPLEGTVPAGGSFYLTFTTEDAGDYELALEGENLSWTLYDDADFSELGGGTRHAAVADCSSGTCTAGSLDGGTDLFLELENAGSSDVDFTLTIDPGLGEGSVNDPIVIASTDGQTHAAQVGTGYSYYRFDLTPTDVIWWIHASGSDLNHATDLEDDIDIYVYTDAFVTESFQSAQPGTVVEEGFDPSGADRLYVKVDGTNSAAGVSFFLETEADD